METILWHLRQVENTTENVAQCRVLCNACLVPCAPQRVCLIPYLCYLRVGRSLKSHHFEEVGFSYCKKKQHSKHPPFICVVSDDVCLSVRVT